MSDERPVRPRPLGPVRLSGLLFGVVGGAVALFLAVAGVGLFAAPEWGSPLWLLALVPIVLLPLQPLVTGSTVLAVPSLEAGPRGLSLRVLLSWLPRGLMVLSLGLMAVALARPQVTFREITRKSEGLDILLAIDTSCSMEATDLATSFRQVSRLEVAKGVVSQFIDGRPNDRIGVVVFGEEAFTHVPLTLDHATLLGVLRHIELGIAGPRGTAIGQAIAVGAKRLDQIENPSRIMVVLTDGQNNAGRITPFDASELAAALGIRIYTIGVGSTRARGFGGLFGAGGDGLDEATLKGIADRTGGAYFRATTASALQDVYTTIDEFETSPAEVEELVDVQDWYQLALVPGVLALLLQLLLSWTWLRRWP